MSTEQRSSVQGTAHVCTAGRHCSGTRSRSGRVCVDRRRCPGRLRCLNSSHRRNGMDVAHSAVACRAVRGCDGLMKNEKRIALSRHSVLALGSGGNQPCSEGLIEPQRCDRGTWRGDGNVLVWPGNVARGRERPRSRRRASILISLSSRDVDGPAGRRWAGVTVARYHGSV